MHKKYRTILSSLSALGLLLIAPCSIASGQKGKLANLHIHGFLTQAYGEARLGDDPEFLSWLDGNILGLTEDGTTDYRTMALQFRYDLSAESSIVIQLDHERTAEDFSLLREDDIELDWAFFSHRFANDLRIKVGRIPLPWGIYNEIRDVGTILPFYRPPDQIYREAGSFDGTFEGLLLARSFFDDSRWPVEVDIYWGESEWESNSLDLDGQRTPVSGRVERVGLRSWLNTPIDGLRFGFSILDESFRGGVIPPSETLPADIWMVSVDATFDRFFVRAEFQRTDSILEQDLGRSNFEKDTYYLEGGIKLIGGLELIAQYLDGSDDSKLVDDPDVNPLVTPEPVRVASEIDRVVGLRYEFERGIVLRAEYHNRDDVFPRLSQLQITPRPDGRANLTFPSDTGKADFFIVSFSASF